MRWYSMLPINRPLRPGSHAIRRSCYMHTSQSSRARAGNSVIRVYGSLALAAISAIALAVYSKDPLLTEAGTRNDERKKNTKYFRLKDIKAHGAESRNGIWVSRGTSVYDITEWIDGHPGGSVIMRAAGSALEPYWSVFAFHQRPDIAGMLDEFKIGEVSFLSISLLLCSSCGLLASYCDCKPTKQADLLSPARHLSVENLEARRMLRGGASSREVLYQI